MTTATPLKIDVVSDVACPWCAVGLASLEAALQRLDGQVQAQLHFQPFELNPQMGPQGQDISEHLTQKYGSTPEQQQANWEALRRRGEDVGFEFRREGRGACGTPSTRTGCCTGPGCSRRRRSWRSRRSCCAPTSPRRATCRTHRCCSTPCAPPASMPKRRRACWSAASTRARCARRSRSGSRTASRRCRR